MSQSNAIVQASIIHQIIKVAHQTSITPPLIRPKLHSDTLQVQKLIDFFDEQLEKNGLVVATVSSNLTLIGKKS